MMSGPTLLQRPSAGVSKPPLLGRPSAGLRRSEDANTKSTDASFGVHEEWIAVASPSLWEVKCEDLEMVPLDFPLERTNREITDASASEVSTRISNALRQLSIEAEYDCKKAKARCKTSDLVSFRIRLYAGGENKQPVVVEVQRRCGSASSFMQSCRAILNSAEGKKVTDTAKPMKMPISQMKCLQSIVSKVDNTEAMSTSELDCVMNLLRSKHRESNVLGLENLVAITDPVKTTPLVAVRVSRCIVLGDEKYDVREEIRSLCERDIFFPEQDSPLKHGDNLRHLSLAVMANALSACAKDGCLADVVKDQQWFEDHLIPLLVDEIKRASSSACTAHKAACCILSLLECSSVARHIVEKNGGVEALKDAHKVGQRSHELLKCETLRCIEALELSGALAV